MLILTRKRHQSIMIGKTIRIEVVEIDGEAIRLGIDAPRIVPVHRQEIFDRIQRATHIEKQYATFHYGCDSNTQHISDHIF